MKILLFNPPLYAGKYYTEAEECCFGLVGRPVVPHHLLRIASDLKLKHNTVQFKDYAIDGKPWADVRQDLEGFDLGVTSVIHGADAHALYLTFYEPLHHHRKIVALCYPAAITNDIYRYFGLNQEKRTTFRRSIPDFQKEITIDYSLYPYHKTLHKVYVVQAATGCRYNCNFCVWAGKKYLLRTPEAVIAQLASVKVNMTPQDSIFLLSSQITSDKLWLKRFVDLKQRLLPDLKFNGDIGIGEVDQKTAQLLKSSGIENATIGAEALSGGWLRKFRKGWSYDSIKKGLLELQRAGVSYHLILRCGIGETPADIVESTRNLTELVSLGVKPEYVKWGKIYPYPGTAIAELEGKQTFLLDLKVYVASLREVGWIKT